MSSDFCARNRFSELPLRLRSRVTHSLIGMVAVSKFFSRGGAQAYYDAPVLTTQLPPHRLRCLGCHLLRGDRRPHNSPDSVCRISSLTPRPTGSPVAPRRKQTPRGDVTPSSSREAAFKIISSAYEVLGNASRRAAYDRTLLRTSPRHGALGRSRASRSRLTGLSFLKRFLGKSSAFGWDLSAKPPGDMWEHHGDGQYVRSTGVRVHITHAISGEELRLRARLRVRSTCLCSLRQSLVLLSGK